MAGFHVELLLLLTCIVNPCFTATEPTQQRNATKVEIIGPEEPNTSSCWRNSTARLTFVTSLSVRGCPIFVHRVGEVKVGKFVIEPTFCLTSTAALRSPSAHRDLLTSESYFSFPVNVTDEMLLAEAVEMLSHLSPKSVAFLEVTSVRLTGGDSLAFKKASFLWGPTELVGHLRLVCQGFNCLSLPLYLWKGQTEALEKLRLATIMRVSEGCAPVTATYPITIAADPLMPIDTLQRERASTLRTCSDLKLFRVVQMDNCTAYVHQRQDKKGHFVIEPLLCPTANFSLLTDYSLGKHYVKLPAIVEDASVIASVRNQIPLESIKFMKLWDASIHTTSRLSQWQIQSIRLSSDRKTAELRAYCTNQSSCDLLGSVLRSEPVNFWKNIRWTAISVLNDECEFRTEQRRFAFRMKDRAVRTRVPISDNSGQWGLEALRNRTVMRDGRAFIVVTQRRCGSISFQRYWKDYRGGFGDADNFWIGLEIMHSLTWPQGKTMRVEMMLWNDTEWFAEYSDFTVGNLSTKYIMTFSRMNTAKSTLLVDALTNGYRFSTRDVDNDVHSTANYCSVNWGYAGWWFSNCGSANPNGVYYSGETTNTAYSTWYFKEGWKALKEFRMLIEI